MNQLPRASKFREAQADDEDLARRIVEDKPKAPPRAAVPLSAFTPEYELLTAAVELLQVLNANVIKLASGKPPQPRPLPRPVTAVDRLREAKRAQRIDALIAEVKQAQERWAQARETREENASG